jgi:formate dehydrogenase subunit gamma
MGKNSQKSRHTRIMLWSLAVILCGSLVLPLTGYVYVGLMGTTHAQAQEETNPRAAFWGAARQSQEGYVASSGAYTTNTLIQNGGQNWRQYRNGPVSTYGPWVLAISLLAIGLFHIITRGGVKLEAERSGRTVQRWSVFERYLHWFTAVLFIVLTITGLSMLFGRAVLIPVLGSAGFAAWAQVSMTLHNYLGPFFVVGVLLEILFWIRYNIPNATDLKWFAQGGGLIGKGHPSSGRMNGGEKLWFWIIATFGVAVCVTGLILDFPNFGFSREDMQLANLIHAIAAMIWVAVAFGHIYIGTAGTEGSLEGMTTGRVSVEWAKQHHDLWYEEVKDTAEDTSRAEAPAGKAQTSS